MNSIDFCYWLQGYFEVSGSEQPTKEQTEIIKNHLNLVFKHEIDPLRNSQTLTKPDELNNAHEGVEPVEPSIFNSGNDMQIRC